MVKKWYFYGCFILKYYLHLVLFLLMPLKTRVTEMPSKQYKITIVCDCLVYSVTFEWKESFLRLIWWPLLVNMLLLGLLTCVPNKVPLSLYFITRLVLVQLNTVQFTGLPSTDILPIGDTEQGSGFYWFPVKM